MAENYEIAVKIDLIDKISAQLGSIGVGLGKLNDKVLSLNNSLKSLALGAVLAAPLISAVSQAAKFQQVMLTVQTATQASAAQMRSLKNEVLQVAGPTQFSALDVAQMSTKMVTSGLTMQQTTQLLPVFAKFADVMKLQGKSTNPIDAVRTLVTLAHQANIYDVAGITAYATALTKGTLSGPGSLSEFAGSLKYSQAAAKNALGITPQDTILATALAERFGLSGSVGGTNLINALTRSIPGVFGSGLFKGKSMSALTAIGLVDSKGHSTSFTNGKFDLVKFMTILESFEAKEFATKPEALARQEIVKDIQYAFGSRGRIIALDLASKQAMEQWQKMQKNIQGMGSVSQIQEGMLNNSVQQQYTQLVSNIHSAMIELGITLLPIVLKLLKEINAGLAILIPWMESHEALVKKLAEGLALMAGIGIIVGSVGLLALAFTSLSSPILGVATGLFVLYEAFEKIKDFLSPLISRSSIGVGGSGGFVFSSNMGNQKENHIHIKVGAKEIAHVVTKEQARQASMQPSHGSLFNNAISLGPNMYQVNQGI